MIILCHVSDKKVDILDPKESAEDAICFSENKFITYFGEYLYLFDLKTLQANFHIQKLPTTGLFCSQHLLSDSLEPEVLEYKSKSLGYEWRVRDRISVDKFALGVLGHWNHMEGIVGKGSVEQAMTNMAVDLMQYLR